MTPQFVPISEQVWVPVHRIERISFWNDSAMVKFVDTREEVRVNAEDAARIRAFIEGTNRVPDVGSGGRKGKK